MFSFYGKKCDSITHPLIITFASLVLVLALLISGMRALLGKLKLGTKLLIQTRTGLFYTRQHQVAAFSRCREVSSNNVIHLG